MIGCDGRWPLNPEVTVIGCDGLLFGPEAAAALAKAQLVVGAPRHLDADRLPPSRKTRSAWRSSTSTRPSTPSAKRTSE